MLFSHENDIGNKNKLGQGPAAYDTTSRDRDNIGRKFAFTIGKVSHLDCNIDCVYLDREERGNCDQ
jgi:hypothetical protein